MPLTSRIPFEGVFQFEYFQLVDTLFIGDGFCCTTFPGHNNFAFFIDHASTTPLITSFNYTTVANTSSNYIASTFSLAPAVPEPASLALLAVGLAGLGMALRLRRA